MVSYTLYCRALSMSVQRFSVKLGRCHSQGFQCGCSLENPCVQGGQLIAAKRPGLQEVVVFRANHDSIYSYPHDRGRNRRTRSPREQRPVETATARISYIKVRFHVLAVELQSDDAPHTTRTITSKPTVLERYVSFPYWLVDFLEAEQKLKVMV